jgi:glycosyltransferase involved in cell wall biosynthesis
MKKTRLLFLNSGPSFPRSIPFQTRFRILSGPFVGDVITPVLKPEDLSVATAGDFRLHSFPYVASSSLRRSIVSTLQIVRRALALGAESSVDVVISPNPLLTGCTALYLARRLKAACVVEVNGNFETAFKFGKGNAAAARLSDRGKELAARFMIPFVLSHADMVKLVYHRQLGPLRLRQPERLRTRSFPNLVPLGEFASRPVRDDRFILLVGYPWYLKGVDVLIRAFLRISDRIPDYSLKIVGWCPEGRDYFEQLAAGHPRIQLLDAVEYDAIVDLMTSCSVYVLASRTDSSPRVIREAMASRKPVIASNVDGVPDLIADGTTGLLFERENDQDLAEKLLRILSEPALAARLSQAGFSFVLDQLSEASYLRHYREMIEAALTNAGASR